MSGYKKFDLQLYQQNDLLARSVTIQYLRTEGLVAEDNPDPYGVDLLVRLPDERTYIYAVEVEVKRVWNAGTAFPWPTIQVPTRKLKYTNQPLWVEYWILRSDLQAAVVIPEGVLVNSPRREVPNKYISKGEYFYRVPITECIQLDLVGDVDIK